MRNSITLDLCVSGSGYTPAEIDDVTRLIQSELLELEDVDVIPRRDGAAIGGAKSADVAVIGALAVTVAPTVVAVALDVIASWLQRQPRDVEVEIDGHRLKGPVTRKQRDQLVEAFVNRVAAESADE